jgi:hypothetical protein
VYQRSHPNKKHYIGTSHGNECLTYVTYIKDHYHCLPDAVVFVHADAKRHCPLIEDVLQLPNEDLLRALRAPARTAAGYLPLSKVFLNQTRENLEKFKYPLIKLSNYVQKERYNFRKHVAQFQGVADPGYMCSPLPILAPASSRLPENEQIENDAMYTSEYCDVVDGAFPFVAEYPDYVTTYTSGSFVVSREKIHSYPLHFYEQLSEHLSSDKGSRCCGYLEYIWTTMWGGEPFQFPPDSDRSCGPLYYTDISRNSGFEFIKSDDGSVEAGKLPDGYHGRINLRDN